MLARNPDRSRIRVGWITGAVSGAEVNVLKSELRERERNPSYHAEDGTEKKLKISKEEYDYLATQGATMDR